ncbi:MAG: hypothetical protein ISR55_08930 [Bacteroidetes bacterium]|nr:hypothetical protein [Bacteroidota bacterium]MBL6963935.1 hypothetical protein [Bacteroidota bacterium]
MKSIKFQVLIVFLFLSWSSLFAQSQIIEVIDGDVLNLDPHLDNYVLGVIIENDSFLWGYYDCTDCADYFLSKKDSEKDLSFRAFFLSKGINIKAVYRSHDGRIEERCELCSCPNGHRINFKVLKSDYSKMRALLKGTINHGLINKYK